MQILPKIEIIDLALYADSTLIIADVHIGYEEALNKRGILVPRIQFGEIVKSMEKIFSRLEGRPIETIIVNGDLKHEFGTISEQEWRNTLKFIDLLLKHCGKVILIKGNHDTILGPIARKREVEVKDHHIIQIKDDQSKKPSLIKKLIKTKSPNILVTHGDKIPPKEVLKDIGAIIIGHEHPAITLKEGPRMETFKCFLKGKYEGKHLIAQPSFNSMIEGTDILKDSILSPFLKQSLGNFEVYAVEDQVYNFGKLKNLR